MSRVIDALASVFRRLRSVLRRLGHFHGRAKSFDVEVERAGIAARVEGGMRTIPVAKIVGSVGRAQNLRSDFFYRTGQAMTARFERIGQAMKDGKILPPIEVYKARLRRPDEATGREVERTEYYVVDGHHRVAMAKKLDQAYLDAHVVEFRVAGEAAPLDSSEPPGTDGHSPRASLPPPAAAHPTAAPSPEEP